MGKVVGVIAVLVLAAGCGAAGPSTARHGQRTAWSCIGKPGYGGLGASRDRFDANNNNSTGPAEPTPGAAWYYVIGVAGGCVSAYQVQDSASPPLKARDMLDLVSPYLPADAKRLVDTGSCAVWRSPSLRRAIGLLYARATAIAQIGSIGPGSAQMKATAASTC